MGVIYRAIWTESDLEDVAESLDRLRRCIAVWVTEDPDSDTLPVGSWEREVSNNRVRHCSVRTVGESGYETRVTDRRPGDTSEWTTVIRLVGDESGIHVFVDNRMESDDLTQRISVGRPRVVHDLLVLARNPLLGGSRPLTEPTEVPSNGIEILLDKLADPDRTLPIIVCSEPPNDADGLWRNTANRIASRVEGIAVVLTLDSAATTAFRNELGDLAIWGGAIRIYMPRPVTRGSEGWRHRFYTHKRLVHSLGSTIDRIVYSVAQVSTNRRIPAEFDIFKELIADEPVLDLERSGSIPRDEFEVAREEWALDMDLALEERSGVEKELAAANGHLARLKDALSEHGLENLVWATKHETEARIPDTVQDTSEAVLSAQCYLSEWLVVPETAKQELDDIDTSPASYAWGNRAWHGFRALAAYAQDRSRGWDNGGFWDWCFSGQPLGWPATSKKLSMTESDAVQQNPRLSRTRVFAVDPEVAESGYITMLAHLKVAEGGNNLTPRIYFYDDTGGSTGKVHVGFVGPHSLVPNKSTN